MSTAGTWELQATGGADEELQRARGGQSDETPFEQVSSRFSSERVHAIEIQVPNCPRLEIRICGPLAEKTSLFETVGSVIGIIVCV